MIFYKKKIYFYLKIGLDFVFAVSCLPIFLIILLVLAVLIPIDSKGGIFFIQDRVGWCGRTFKCFKFRTMKIGTPNISTQEMQKIGLSPITRVGYWLRRTSLDELPQLLNIFMGQMSFIGPRPALPSQDFVIKMRRDYKVDMLLPGITGLAQVRGRDSLTDFEKVKFDYQYYQEFSFTQDLRILIETIKTVSSNKGNK